MAGTPDAENTAVEVSSDSPSKKYLEVILAAARANIASGNIKAIEEEARSFSVGFMDGVSWMIRRCEEIGIEVPDGKLFLTKETL